MSIFLPRKYVKEEPNDEFVRQVNYKFAVRTKIMPYTLPTIASILLVTQVVLPLVSFTTQDVTVRPVASSALGLATGFQEFEYKELGTKNVLGTSTSTKDKQNIPEFYYISIPKLGIKDALVETNAKSLNPENALGHYTGSSLPGEVGNAFIYGHSVLPMFFNPKNYKTIFSTLHKLEIGDEIFVNYNNKNYTYKVERKRDLYPSDVYPLAEIKPAYMNESTMVLMTCSPPGTKLKRLLIDTVLVK